MQSRETTYSKALIVQAGGLRTLTGKWLAQGDTSHFLASPRLYLRLAVSIFQVWETASTLINTKALSVYVPPVTWGTDTHWGKALTLMLVSQVPVRAGQ